MWVPWGKTCVTEQTHEIHTNVVGLFCDAKNLNCFVSLGIAEILGFSGLSVYTEVFLLKTFPQHFELSLYSNIEVMKLCNLGDKTFQTDFNYIFNHMPNIKDFIKRQLF